MCNILSSIQTSSGSVYTMIGQNIMFLSETNFSLFRFTDMKIFHQRNIKRSQKPHTHFILSVKTTHVLPF